MERAAGEISFPEPGCERDAVGQLSWVLMGDPAVRAWVRGGNKWRCGAVAELVPISVCAMGLHHHLSVTWWAGALGLQHGGTPLVPLCEGSGWVSGLSWGRLSAS